MFEAFEFVTQTHKDAEFAKGGNIAGTIVSVLTDHQSILIIENLTDGGIPGGFRHGIHGGHQSFRSIGRSGGRDLPPESSLGRGSPGRVHDEMMRLHPGLKALGGDDGRCPLIGHARRLFPPAFAATSRG